MRAINLNVPVLDASTQEVPESATAATPASLRDTIRNAITTVTIDQQSLDDCISSLVHVFEYIREASQLPASMRFSGVAIELGITSTGKVVLLGAGLEMQVAAKMQLNFEVSVPLPNTEESLS